MHQDKLNPLKFENMKANETPITKKEIIEKAMFKFACNKRKIDKRYIVFKNFLSLGYTKQDLINMAKTKEKRRELIYKEREYKQRHWEHAERVYFLCLLKTCTYYKEIKYDNTEKNCVIHRPTINGKGWAMIELNEQTKKYCTEEPTEDPILVKYYTRDPILVKFLYKKYNLQFKN